MSTCDKDDVMHDIEVTVKGIIFDASDYFHDTVAKQAAVDEIMHEVKRLYNLIKENK